MTIDQPQTIIYCRKASATQDNNALEEQKAQCINLAEQNNIFNYEIIEEYGSASTKLMQKINNNEIDTIICTDLNRMSRQSANSAVIIKSLITKCLKKIITSKKAYYPTSNPLELRIDFGLVHTLAK